MNIIQVTLNESIQVWTELKETNEIEGFAKFLENISSWKFLTDLKS